VDSPSSVNTAGYRWSPVATLCRPTTTPSPSRHRPWTMTMVGSPVANDAAHSPGSESTRRRKQSLSPLRSWQAVPFQMELGDDDEHEPDNDNHELGISTPTATCTPADERQPVTMRESIWNHIIGKSKALVLGQMLAFWLVSALFLICIALNVTGLRSCDTILFLPINIHIGFNGSCTI